MGAASHLAVAPAAIPAAVNTGTSTQYRSQDSVGNFNFGYNEDHATGGSFRREQSDAYGIRTGSYGLRDADGRSRIVNYVADAAGFRANIQTNEPGVEPKDPAATLINKQVAIAAAPVPVAVAAPAPVPVYAAPAPVAVAPAPLAAPLPAPHYAPGPYYAAAPALVPRAFSYAVVANHLAPAALPVPLPLAPPAPTYGAPAYGAPAY
ncbi:hypothetical protein GZH46_00697, partial [Fragariocoptes setiger]